LDPAGAISLVKGSSTTTTTLSVNHDFFQKGALTVTPNTLVSVGDLFQADGIVTVTGGLPSPNPSKFTSSSLVLSGALTVAAGSVLSTNTLQIALGAAAALGAMSSIVDTGLFTNQG